MDPQNPFLIPGNHETDHEDSQEVIAERAIADAGQSQALYNFNQKLLEQKERELMESIAMNYGRIRDVERELGNLQLQLKLTSGPKKHALELLRKKIEAQNEKVANVRAKHTAAKATYERLDAELKTEEAVKEQLCGELNTLVQQAAKAQLDKLEELKATLEGLYSGYVPKQGGAQQQPQQQQPVAGGQAGPSGAAAPGTAAPPPPPQQQQQPQQAEAGASGSEAAGRATAASTPTEAAEQQEQLRRRQERERLEQERLEQERRAAEERRRREAEAAAARSRHVSLGSASGSSGGAAAAVGGPTGRQAGQGGAGPGGAAAAARPKAANGGAEATAAAAAAGGTAGGKQRFAGFDT